MNNMDKVKAAYIKKYPHLQRVEKNNKAFFDAAFRLIPPAGVTPLELDQAMKEACHTHPLKRMGL